MVIKYVAYTWQGEKVEGVLDVIREQDARELLHQQELIPYRLTRVRPLPSWKVLAPYLFRPKPQEMIEFTRGVASLLRSGIPLREAVIIFRNESSSLGLKEVLRRIIEDIEGGQRFSDAMGKFPSYFSRFYIRILRFGEATGAMAQAMQQLGENLEKTKTMKDKVKGALVYPVLSLIVAIVVAVILITYSLPALIGLLEDFGGELPTITKVLISMSDIATAYRVQMFLFVGGAAAVCWAYFKTRNGSKMRDRLLLKIPVVKGVLVQSNLFNFTAVFATLLQAGIPTTESLRLSSESVNNHILRDRTEQIIKDVTEGARLGQSFRQHWPDPPLLSQAIITGEASGSLALSLRGLADYYEQESVRAISGATEMIQPVVIILVAGLVGFVATAVMSGIYSSLNSIQ